MLTLLEKKAIISDAEPHIITNEPEASTKTTLDSDVIRVSLDVNCCPCPKSKDCKCDDCKCDDCKCNETCGCEKKEEDVLFFRRWFPMFSRTSL